MSSREYDAVRRREQKAEDRLSDCDRLGSSLDTAEEINRRNGLTCSPGRLSLLSHLGAKDKVCLVGGQAVGLWAAALDPKGERLSGHMPFTTADIDYFGALEAARRFTDAVGGKLFRPSADTMNSNSTALVRAPAGDEILTIDFLHAIIGVERDEIEKGTVEVSIADGQGTMLLIPVLHPVLMMRSRIANMLSAATMRRDAISFNQARASIEIVALWAEARISEGNLREAMKTLSAVVSHATVDHYGKRAVRDLGIDQLDSVRRFADDVRLDERWRTLTFKPRIAECGKRRQAMTERS